MKIISADITGSLIINNQDVTTTVESSSIWSGSIASRVTNLEQFSSSLDATFATDQQLNQATASLSSSIGLLSSSYLATSQSYDIVSSSFSVISGSYSAASGSFSTRVTNNESTASVLTTASASFAVVSGSYSTASGSLSTRVTTLEAASASLNTASGSFSTRVTNIEGNYATTGSNIFTGAQTVCANITSTGTIIAQTLNVQQVTSSIVYSSGSNTFGCSLSNVQQFTGSVFVTGSTLTVSGGNLKSGDGNVFGRTTICTLGTPQILSTRNGSVGLSINSESDCTHFGWRIANQTVIDGGFEIARSSVTGSNNSFCNPYFLIKSDGTVGVNCLSPTSTLTVGGTSRYGGEATFEAAMTGTSACFSSFVCSSTLSSTRLFVCGGSSNNYIASTNNEVLRLQSFCPSGMYATFYSGSTAIGDIGTPGQIFSSGNTTGFGINARGSANLEFGTLQSQKLVIFSTGEACFTGAVRMSCLVSAGTVTGTSATFSGKLTVSNSTDAYGELTTSAIDADSLLGFSNTGDGNSSWGIGRRNTGEFWIANYTCNFLNGTRTIPFQIASTGVATFTGPQPLDQAICNIISFTDAANNSGYLGIVRSSTTGNGASLSSDGKLVFRVNSTCVAQTIASTGETTFNSGVSIGTPIVGRLGVRGTTNDSTAYAFEAANSCGNTLFIVRNDGLSYFSTGNVGIGTASPQSTLHLCTVNTTSAIRIESACDQAGVRLIAGVPGTARASRIDFLNGATCVGRPQWTIINDYNQNGTNALDIVNCDPLTKVFTISQNGQTTIKSSTYDVAVFNSTYGQSDIVIQNNGTSFAVFGSGISVTSTAAVDDVGIGTAGLAKAIVFANGTSYTERLRITCGGTIKQQSSQAIGACLQSGTIANNTCLTVNLNSAGGNNSIGFVAIGVNRPGTNCGTVRMWSQYHTQNANTYCHILGNNEGGITITNNSDGGEAIINCSGGTVNYVIRYLNIMSQTAISELT